MGAQQQNVSIPCSDCHLQAVGMGGLICRGADRDSKTNETTNEICIDCKAGKIYRECACDSVTPKIRFYKYNPDLIHYELNKLFCSLKKTITSYDECKQCSIPISKETKSNINQTKALFTEDKFYSAYNDLEKARNALRDGNYDSAIGHSTSCLESVMKTIHERLGIPLPSCKQLTDLWKSTRELLKLNELDSEETTIRLLNSMSGLIQNFANYRNVLSDFHGDGENPDEIQSYMAELAINMSSAFSIFSIRRYNDLERNKDE